MSDETPAPAPWAAPAAPPAPIPPPTPPVPPTAAPPVPPIAAAPTAVPPVTAPFAPPTVTEPFAPPAPPQLPPAARRSRRGAALGAVAVLVAVAAAGGVGYGVLHGDGKHGAKAATTPWTAPSPTATKAFGARSGGSHYGSPKLLLLPVPSGYTPGPDADGYGNDVALNAEQAQAMVKGESGGGSAKERKELAESIAALHIESAGLRTYSQVGGGLVIRMEIVQMKNEEAARAEPDYFAALTKAMGVFRTGPKVKGYPKAVCVLAPADPHGSLDSMTCEATEGDLMVVMTADGTKPLRKTEAADVLRKQLDRIKDPGEAV